MRVRHRASKLLLRQGIVYPGSKTWTATHQRWLQQQRFDAPPRQLAFEDAVEAVLLTTDRRDRLDAAIEVMAADSSYTPLVRRLCCLRGISTLTGFGLAVEIGDWHRFSGSSIGAFLGLVPTGTLRVNPGPKDQSLRPATGMPAGCSWRPPGITVRATAAPARICGTAGSCPQPRQGPRP